jgi:hypothetical protein
MITTKSKILLLLLTFSIYHLPFSITQATIRYVSSTGNNIPPYLTWEDAANSIQDCINVSVSGDTVLVANGIYKENLVINTQISLIGSSMDSTVIDGTGLGDITIRFNVSGNIENFNIYGKERYTGGVAAIYSIVGTFPIIEVRNCQISETGVGIAGWGLIADNLLMKNLRSGINIAGNPNSENYIINSIIILDRQNSYGIDLPGPSWCTKESIH